MDRLRVLTLNIWHQEHAWEQRRKVIRSGLSNLEPDVVGLQEVLRSQPDGATLDQAREIAEGSGYHLAYGAAQPFRPQVDFGNAVLSKHPILETHVAPLPGEADGERRSVLHARLDTPLGEVPVFVTHLNWRRHHGSVRVAQVQALCDVMNDRAPPGPGFPPVLMGDFNADADSDEIRFLRGLATVGGRSVYFADAFEYAGIGPGHTLDKRNPFARLSQQPARRIDYIFVRGLDKSLRGEPLHARVVFDAPDATGMWASDHFGVYAELNVGET